MKAYMDDMIKIIQPVDHAEDLREVFEVIRRYNI